MVTTTTTPAEFNLEEATALAKRLDRNNWEDILQDAYIKFARYEGKLNTRNCVRYVWKNACESRKVRATEEVTVFNQPIAPTEEVDLDRKKVYCSYIDEYCEHAALVGLDLSPKQRILVNLLLGGKSKAEASLILGVSRPRVSAMLDAIRAKLA